MKRPRSPRSRKFSSRQLQVAGREIDVGHSRAVRGELREIGAHAAADLEHVLSGVLRELHRRRASRARTRRTGAFRLRGTTRACAAATRARAATRPGSGSTGSAPDPCTRRRSRCCVGDARPLRLRVATNARSRVTDATRRQARPAPAPRRCRARSTRPSRLDVRRRRPSPAEARALRPASTAPDRTAPRHQRFANAALRRRGYSTTYGMPSS